MRFYESERIIRKNRKYVKSKAYDAYRDSQKKGLSDEEIMHACECAMKHTNVLNETQIDILGVVRNIAKSNLEKNDETIPNDGDEPSTTDSVQQ